MTPSSITQPLAALLAFPFKDPKWKTKALIGAVLIFFSLFLLVPIFFVYGYFGRVLKRAISGEGEALLPEWDDWGELFVSGLKLFGAGFVYLLPGTLISVFGYAIVFLPSFLVILSSDMENTAGATLGLLQFFGSFGGMAVFGVAMLVNLTLGAFLPAAIGHLVARDSFGAAFRFGEWWPIFRANLGGFLVSYVMLIGFAVLAMMVSQVLYMTIVLCCFYPVALSVFSLYLMAIAGALFGRAYRAGVENLAVKSVQGSVAG